MTLRQLIEAAGTLTDEQLDAELRIYLTTRDDAGNTFAYRSPVKNLGYFSEDMYVGPEGVYSATEIRENLALHRGVADDYQEVMFSKGQVVLRVEDCVEVEWPDPANDSKLRDMWTGEEPYVSLFPPVLKD